MKSLLLDNIVFFLSSRHVYIDDDAILRTYSWLTNVTVSVLTWQTLTLTFLNTITKFYMKIWMDKSECPMFRIIKIIQFCNFA